MTEPKPKPPQAPQNWAQRLGQTSAGLPPVAPQKTDPSATSDDAAESRRLWRLAGLGLQFAGTTALLFFLGHQLDLWMNWPNTAAITGAVLAIVGSLYLIIKEGLNANKPPPPKPPTST